jgi:hypothetical protein
MNQISAVGAALREATRPRSSGSTRNVHVVRSQRVVLPNFEKMRLQIEGSDTEIKEIDKVEEEYPSGDGAVSVFFGVPVPGHEFVDAIDLVIGEALENPCEPCLRIDVVQLAGFHERVGDGGGLSAAD